MVDSLRWGILSTGAIARKFAMQLVVSRTGKLVAVGSRTEESASKFGESFPGVRTYGTYDGVLADPEVEAVYIAPPHPMHKEWAIKAAEAGKHILCEKPLTMNQPDAVEVVEAARKNGVFLMEAFMYRCHPRTARIVELVREGVVGRVRIVRAVFSFAGKHDPNGRLLRPELGGGGILDVGCYTASVTRLVAGAANGKAFEDPIDVKGSVIRAETGVDAMAAATLTFPGEILGELSCGVSLQRESILEIYGEEGMIRLPRFWHPPGPIEVLDYASNTTRVIETDPNPELYAIEADAVAEAIPNQQSPLVSWEDTLGNMRVLDQWRESAGQDLS